MLSSDEIIVKLSVIKSSQHRADINLKLLALNFYIITMETQFIKSLISVINKSKHL